MTPRMNSPVSASSVHSSSQSTSSQWAQDDLVIIEADDDDPILHPNLDQPVVVVEEGQDDDDASFVTKDTIIDKPKADIGCFLASGGANIFTCLRDDVPFEIDDFSVDLDGGQKQGDDHLATGSNPKDSSLVSMSIECNSMKDSGLAPALDNKNNVEQRDWDRGISSTTISNPKARRTVQTPKMTVIQSKMMSEENPSIPYSVYPRNLIVFTFFICFANTVILGFLFAANRQNDLLFQKMKTGTDERMNLYIESHMDVLAQITALNSRMDSIANGKNAIIECASNMEEFGANINSESQVDATEELKSSKKDKEATFVVTPNGDAQPTKKAPKLTNIKELTADESHNRKERKLRKMMRDRRMDRKQRRMRNHVEKRCSNKFQCDGSSTENDINPDYFAVEGVMKPDTSEFSYLKQLFLVDLWDSDAADVLYATREVLFALTKDVPTKTQAMKVIGKENSGFAVLAGALRKWYHNEQIQAYGIECFRIILTYDWYRFASIAWSTDIVGVILAAMKNYPNNDSIQGFGCEVVSLFVRDANGMTSKPVLALEVIDATIGAMKKHPSNAKVQRFSSQILYYLTLSDGLLQSISKAGGVKAMKKVSKLSKNDPETQKWISYVLRRFDTD